MLKKTLAAAALAIAGTGAIVGIAPGAQASDTDGGDYSQNVNILPHLCIDLKNVADGNGLVGANAPIGSAFEGQQCNEKSKILDKHKEALSDLADIGAHQS